MLTNYVRKRGSGKTTEIIKRMQDEPGVSVMVLNNHHKQLFPKNLREKIITLNDYDLSRRLNDVVRTNGTLLIDEGYVICPDKAAELFYMLGSYGVNVEVYGSFR